jgi:NADPH:quinone reductase-like Zn-dependent oxidoreductase
VKTEVMALSAHGGPEVITRQVVEIGEPGPREVLVRVRAVAVNHIDIWVRRGMPYLKLAYPHRLGSDVVGEVEAIGQGARNVRLADRVVVSPGLSCGVCEQCLSGRDNLCVSYAILGEHVSGGYGRHVIVPDTNLLPYPADMAPAQVAAVPLVFLTAWQMLVDKARVSPTQTVLVHAAGSGVSSAAIQIAKLHGARVLATVGADAKAERAKALGADEVINYSKLDFVAEVKRLTLGRGADVVIDHVGGDVLANSVRATANGGCVVTCGATAGHAPKIDLRHIFFRQVQIVGSTMGSKGSLFTVLSHIAAGRLRPVVDRVIPLWEAPAAHSVLEARQAFGKVVLEVD